MGNLITTYGYKNQCDEIFDDSDTLFHIFPGPAKFSRHYKISWKKYPLFSPLTLILTEYLQIVYMYRIELSPLFIQCEIQCWAFSWIMYRTLDNNFVKKSVIYHLCKVCICEKSILNFSMRSLLRSQTKLKTNNCRKIGQNKGDLWRSSREPKFTLKTK